MTIETIDFVPAPLLLTPAHMNGDDDFWGPPMFSLHAWLQNRGRYITLMVEAVWEEPKGDHTLFRFNRVQPLYDIQRLKGPGWTFAGFDDEYDVTVEPLPIPGSDGGSHLVYGVNDAGLINSIEAIGDSYGGWFGGADHPGGTVYFNRVRFNVKK